MKMKDNVEAVEALMRWFASQSIDEGEACDIATLFLALTIRGVAKGNRAKQTEGLGILVAQVTNLVQL